MSQFLGTHQTRLDAKGRSSVPAPFRTALRAGAEGGGKLILRPSHKHPCIEGWPAADFYALAKPMSALDLFSEDADDLQLALYAEATAVEADKDGRIIIPDSLVTHAGLNDTAAFMGLGTMFQIWEPGAAARRTAAALERARSRNLTLPGRAG